MSARKHLSARDKKYGKLVDCLPSISQQKFLYRSNQELPPLSANTSVLNRNLNFTYDKPSFLLNSANRSTTPLSDFFSDSEAETPDFLSEESDSSSGSILRRTTAEATKSLSEEWNRIERTLYNEEGEKCTRPSILEECRQWRQLHPQLRVVGKAIPLPDKRSGSRLIQHDEVITMHYSDYEQFSESEERLSQSSTDVTPQNSPRPSVASISEEYEPSDYEQFSESEERLSPSSDVTPQNSPRPSVASISEEYEPRLSRERVSLHPNYEDEDLPDSFCSLLHITPIQIRSPLHRRKQNSSILRSELASSRWMRNSRPDSTVNSDRNSAKSLLDNRNYMALSASERNILNGVNRTATARHRDLKRLEPICTPELLRESPKAFNCSQQYQVRKVSLPPLLLEDGKRKVASAKKSTKTRKISQPFYHLDKVRQ